MADPEVLHTPLAGRKQSVVVLQQLSVSASRRLEHGCMRHNLWVLAVGTCQEEVAGSHTTRQVCQVRRYRSFPPFRVLKAWCWACCCQS